MDKLSNEDRVIVRVDKTPDGFILIIASAPDRLTGMAIELTKDKADKLLRDLQSILY